MSFPRVAYVGGPTALPVDAVLLSHDHHLDNLDHGGRAMLGRAARVLTTTAGAERLGSGARVPGRPGDDGLPLGRHRLVRGRGRGAARFPVRLALLFMGAARVAAVGPWHLTFTAEESVEAARALGSAIVVPVHYEGWEHYSESRSEIERTFAAAGLAGHLRWPAPGAPTEIATPTKGDR